MHEREALSSDEGFRRLWGSLTVPEARAIWLRFVEQQSLVAITDLQGSVLLKTRERLHTGLAKLGLSSDPDNPLAIFLPLSWEKALVFRLGRWSALVDPEVYRDIFGVDGGDRHG
jgi:hypothetical protein